MKYMATLILVMPLIASAEAMKCSQLPESISSEIVSFVKSKRGVGGCGYVQKGKISPSSIDKDLIALVSVEGMCESEADMPAGTCGNMHFTYLFAFINLGSEFKSVEPIKIGARGFRLVTSVSISNEKVVSNYKKYDINDAMCCPSIIGKAEYVYSEGEMHEIYP